MPVINWLTIIRVICNAFSSVLQLQNGFLHFPKNFHEKYILSDNNSHNHSHQSPQRWYLPEFVSAKSVFMGKLHHEVNARKKTTIPENQSGKSRIKVDTLPNSAKTSGQNFTSGQSSPVWLVCAFIIVGKVPWADGNNAWRFPRMPESKVLNNLWRYEAEFRIYNLERTIKCPMFRWVGAACRAILAAGQMLVFILIFDI